MLPLLRKLLVVSACCMLGIALPAASGAGAAATTQTPSGATVTKIKLNGLFAQTFLNDGNNLGGLVASQDQIDNTLALDFSYASPDPSNPDQIILTEGAGQIPNSAFTVTLSTAHLLLTTPVSYFVNRCVINTITGSFACAPGTPKSFDLTWVRNRLQTIDEKTTRVEIIGPVTTKLKGEFTIRTANVNGTWDGHRDANSLGTLQDTHSTTFTREITVQANP